MQSTDIIDVYNGSVAQRYRNALCVHVLQQLECQLAKVHV